ncbi:hypothetical protein [Litoreibacter roseus]|nr:hypothetical protein [Litoreibacter roseus]
MIYSPSVGDQFGVAALQNLPLSREGLLERAIEPDLANITRVAAPG